jgi:hypothetical protein
MDPRVEGKRYPAVRLVVEPDRVARFAAAVGAPEGLGPPPTFATAAEFACFPQIVADPELDLDFTRVVHGEQEYEWYRPFAPGETLAATSTLASVRQKGGHGFLTVETELRDEDGELVVLARSTLIERAPA